LLEDFPGIWERCRLSFPTRGAGYTTLTHKWESFIVSCATLNRASMPSEPDLLCSLVPLELVMAAFAGAAHRN
jgi:hypothetical protein